MQEIIKILQKNPETRHEAELELLKEIAKKLLFLEEPCESLEETSIKLCCKCLFYEFHTRNSEISHENGDLLAVLAGSVAFSSKNSQELQENTLFSGDLLGKRGIFNENIAVCKEDCHFAVLKRVDFAKIMGIFKKN